MRTLVIIPAFNAGRTIGAVVEKVSDAGPRDHILVVDDGSADDTLAIMQKSGVIVISHGVNKGKGVALRTGFQYALENGFDGVITIDADMQHDPTCIPSFLSLAESGRLDMIVGSRSRDGDMPKVRIFANYTSSAIVSFFANALVRDSQSGYRWIKASALKRMQLSCDRYDLESEMLLRAGKAHMRIGEVPIPTIYGAERSFINPVTDLWRFLRLLTRSLFW